MKELIPKVFWSILIFSKLGLKNTMLIGLMGIIDDDKVDTDDGDEEDDDVRGKLMFCFDIKAEILFV